MTASRRSGKALGGGTSYGMRASWILRFARTSRCAIVGGGTRNARAISSVDSPHSVRSDSATCASGASAGWQQVKIRRRRSSGTAASASPGTSGSWLNSVMWPSSPRISSKRPVRRSASMALWRAVEMIHARGFAGRPVRGPLIERDRERVLHRLLGHVEVADEADHRRQHTAELFCIETFDLRAFHRAAGTRLPHQVHVKATGARSPRVVRRLAGWYWARCSPHRLPEVRRMKAAVYYETGGPEVFRYEDVPDPVCDASSVLIDVGAISIEGGDTLHRAGGEMASRPHIVGYQCAGVIRAVGEHVSGSQGRPTRRRGDDAWLACSAGCGAGADDLGPPRRAGSASSAPACRSPSAPRTIACSSSAACVPARSC